MYLLTINYSKDEKDKIIHNYKPLVYHFAKIYGGGYCMDDLVQSGMMGLLKAIDRYDNNKGASFTTYASHYIIGEIRHYVRKEAKYYKPGCINGMQKKVDIIIKDYFHRTG